MATLNYFWLVTCILAAAAASANGGRHASNPPVQAPAPAPGGVDCFTLIFNMADCVPFLAVGSNVTKPDSSCCSGLKTVLGIDAECICQALKSSGDLGFTIDMSKVPALPVACRIKAPPLTRCNVTSAPSTPPSAPPAKPPTNPTPPTGSPPKTPTAPPVPPATKAPAPSTSSGGQVSQAPAPSPHHSGAFSTASIHFSVFAVFFFYILA